MLVDGIYTATYAALDRIAHAMLVLKNGIVVGIDQFGGEYEGAASFDSIRRLNRFDMHLNLPAGVPTITGRATGEQGGSLDFTCEFPTPAPVARFSMELAGRAVDVALRFVRTLPA